jgi:hypothetical protein
MGFLLGLNAILWIAGFLLPVPCFILALREWFKTRNSLPVKPWRQKISQVALGLFALGLAPWIYALSRNWSGSYVDYNGSIAKVSSWGSAGMIIPCALAEGRIRIYLVLGAFGLLFYFDVSLGEIAI